MTAASDPTVPAAAADTPSATDGTDGVVAFVAAIDAAQSVLRAIGDHALGDLGQGITTTQLRLLDRLERLGESRLIDLADALSIAPSTATRLCDTLAERQLIVRHRRGRDRRELQIRLTDAGTQLLSAVRRRTATEWAEVFACIDEEDRCHATRVLSEIASAGAGGGALAEQSRTIPA